MSMISRREALRIGGATLFGCQALPGMSTASEGSFGSRREGRAKSVILFNLFGGPSHIDMVDMKPDAPTEIRGEFRPIATTVPGLYVCEHLPGLARWMHRASLVRSLSHSYNSHNPYAMLTGSISPNAVDNLGNAFARRTDHPGIGSVCHYMGLGPNDFPCHVYLPAQPGYSQGLHRAGPYSGYLGRQYDPLCATCEPKFDREFDSDREMFHPIPPYGVPTLLGHDEAPGLTVARNRVRHSLLEEMDRAANQRVPGHEPKALGRFQRQAVALMNSGRVCTAFDLSNESDATRARYGPTLFGTSTLIARRLVEAGTTFVTITTESRGAGHWDTHANNFEMLKTFNLPNLDRIGTSLLEDLDRRGLLETTLVVMMGEMGREPRINRDAGRDHWPQCGFALLFGGGVKQGFVLGTSDKLGAYVTSHPVSPADLVATIYHRLGVDPETTVQDLTGRPISISHGGKAIQRILA